jgi:serine-type D-Ala-D-Ala carboxypeptidase/endopeptidase (penicillin-binding protein 4)
MLAAPAGAEDPRPLQARVEAVLREAGAGPRFGLVVADEQGREIVSIDPEGRFIPASNTKMLTTAAAFVSLSTLDRPDLEGGAEVRLEPRPGGPPDVVLAGSGDARLSSAPDCVSNCLAALADAVAAKARIVRDVVGDDTFFPDQRWSPGMSWNNIPTRSGTAASALSLDDNELRLTIAPGVARGAPARLDVAPHFEIDNRILTIASGPTSLSYDRLPGSRRLRLTGVIAVGASPELLRLGIDDPAHYAAWRLKSLLEARGVRVTGEAQARHRPASGIDDPALRGSAPAPRPPRPEPLARLTPPALLDDIALINKESQNLHAELLLRRLGRVRGTGSLADGIAEVKAMMDAAGVPPAQWSLSDGSGMSTYNRLSPRGIVRLLRWIEGQPWGSAWRATLPVAGVDGTLDDRFKGTALEGRLFAKTGTLNATNALSGWLVTKSGRTFAFSAYANDVPYDVSGTGAIDAALLTIAVEN